MMQLFESFVEIHIERDENKNTLFVQRYHNSRHFLSFNYYKQYTLGIIAYLITPIFYRLAESNIKEHSDKLLVSSLRFVDFLFKFHKHSFSWKILDISPEMLEVNHAPELKSVAVDLLNYLVQVHINKSNFSFSDYKFDGLIANEIFAMTKTDEVFSALFSFSLDEMLPLKKHYLDLLENTKKEYLNDKNSSVFIDSISSLQVVLGDLHYYDDELEDAEVYYKSAVQALRKGEEDGKMTLERFYVYVRNMLRLGMIYEKRKQYDFAYQIYAELCKWIIQERSTLITPQIKRLLGMNQPEAGDMPFEKMTYEGLKMLYLPFIAKLQIKEKSHIGGIASNHLEQLDEDFESLTSDIDPKAAKLLKAEFYSRVADILYYKNSDLKELKRIKDIKNSSCTACYYYHKALYTLLEKYEKNTVLELLCEGVEQIKENYNMKYCTILARILSDWGNVFFSCDISVNTSDSDYNSRENKCYICDREDCNTLSKEPSNDMLDTFIAYLESKEKNENSPTLEIKKIETKKDITFAMYTISSEAYRRVNSYKRSAYQIYKVLCLFKHYEVYQNKNLEDYIKVINLLSEKAIHYLWYANDDLNVLELNKRKKDFGKETIKDEDEIPLQNLLVDSEITRIRILVKELELELVKTPKELKEYYDIHITSPYKINYSIVARIYRLRLKSKVNYEAYQLLLEEAKISKTIRRKKKFILKENEDFSNLLKKNDYKEITKTIFGKNIDSIQFFENLIAESIYCLIDIAQLLETMDETYLFHHSFIGAIHEHLSFWIRQYEAYEKYKKENPIIDKYSHIEEYLEQYLDQEWREQLSGYRENQRALSHYYKSLEMHSEGRAYHNMIDTMCYLKDDYNDRSDHFNIAEERHLIVNGKIEKDIKELKDIYKESKLYKVNNYFKNV